MLHILIGFVGAAIAQYFNLPGSWLIGPMLASFFAALIKISLPFPAWLEGVVLFLIVLSVGGGIDVTIFADITLWLSSFFWMMASLGISLLVVSFYLRKYCNFTHETAIFSAYPGHLVLVVKLARDTKADLPVVTLLQSFRILILIGFLPFFLTLVGEGSIAIDKAGTDWKNVPLVSVLAVIGISISYALRIPSSFMIGGMLGAFAASLLGFSFGSFPVGVNNLILLLTGLMVGVGFQKADFRKIHSTLPVAVTSVFISFAVMCLVSFCASFILDIPLGQLLLSYAPGGAEVMAIIAVSLGHDPSFVAAHHIVRLLIMAIVLPLAICRLTST